MPPTRIAAPVANPGAVGTAFLMMPPSNATKRAPTPITLPTPVGRTVRLHFVVMASLTLELVERTATKRERTRMPPTRIAAPVANPGAAEMAFLMMPPSNATTQGRTPITLPTPAGPIA